MGSDQPAASPDEWAVGGEKVQTASAQSVRAAPTADELLKWGAAAFPLPWSHCVRLLAVKNPSGRSFYEAEAVEKTQRALTSATRKRR